VEKTPQSIAIDFKGKTITYKELNEQSNKLARYILKKSDKKGVSIGVCMDRSIEMVVAILGIIKSGSSYVPFDPIYPLERLKYMAEIAEVGMIFTSLSVHSKV
jgi:acyl-CoA synthetase (AMP-forming)/AMP-acid ligase II